MEELVWIFRFIRRKSSIVCVFRLGVRRSSVVGSLRRRLPSALISSASLVSDGHR